MEQSTIREIKESGKNLTQDDMVRDWYKFLSAARQQLLIGQWQDAIPLYEQSFCLAETLLWSFNCKNCAVKSYVRTSLEYLYVLKKTNNKATEYLVNNAHKTLRYHISNDTSRALLQPLRDVLGADEAIADSWMNQLFSQDAEVRKSLH